MSYHAYRKMLRRRWIVTSLVLMLAAFVLGLAVAHAQPWPDFHSKWKFKVQKAAGAEPTDPFWAHMHKGDQGFESFTLKIEIFVNGGSNIPQDPSTVPAGNQLRYTAHGVPISPWLDAPWTFVVDVTNPELLKILDGIHDLSFELRGPNRAEIRPHPMYLHLHRGLAVDPTVPILARNHTTDYDDYGNVVSPGVVYVHRSERNMVGYPVEPSVSPWHTPPLQADLYQEEMMPHSELFDPVQMWWEEPINTVSVGLSFIRGIGSKFGTDHAATLYDSVYSTPKNTTAFGLGGHRNFPFKDGPRGIGWASPFIAGQVDSTGGLAFAESGGPLRYMKADGEIITIAGWRVKPGVDPVWILKPLTQIRANMELRGTWLNGQRADPADRGFHYPTDVAIDPNNENIWYVAGVGDHIIWKVVIADRVSWNATVEVFAGSVTHQAGYADGQGVNARFRGPSSLVFDPTCDCLYVADQDNDAIRKITRAGVVSTLFGSPGMGARLALRGIPLGGDDCIADPAPMQCYNEAANRSVSKMEVTAAEAATGVKPEFYRPMTVRVDSKGNLIVLDMGYAVIRRVNPLTGETKHLVGIEGRFARFQTGWAWLDVDRWGNSGPLNSIYYLQGVASSIEGQAPGDGHLNEVFAWLPADGGQPQWVSGKDWIYPDGWGKLSETDLPHYPWMIAIDPRGALYMSGMGEHGITRVRMRKPSDPVPSNYFSYDQGKNLWRQGEPVGGHAMSFKFGHGAHNYLGLPDAWGLQPGVTDAEIITMFEIPASIQATPQRLAYAVNFIRLNAGKQLGAQPPPPPPPAAPIIGYVDGVAINGPDASVWGWACQKNTPAPIKVHLAIGGTAIGESLANQASEAGVAAACGSTGATYRYAIPLSPATRTDHAGKAITVYGIAGGAKTALTGSGLFVVPPLPIPPPPPSAPLVAQEWDRPNARLVCVASGPLQVETLKMVDTCVQHAPQPGGTP